MQQAIRDRVLQATFDLTRESVQSPIGMGAIAKAAGVSRQSLYNHFSSRARLMDAAAAFVAQDIAPPDLTGPADRGLERLILWRADCFAAGIGQVQALADAGTAPSQQVQKDLCRQLATNLFRQNKLSHDWFISSSADMMFAMLSYETWRVLSGRAGWSRDDYTRRITRLMRRSFLREPSLRGPKCL